MDRVAQPGDGLCAVRGLDQLHVERLCSRHQCEIAIINPERLFIIGGASLAIQGLREEALAAGAARASVLPINIASHTTRMEKAVGPFKLAIDSARPRRLASGRTLLSGSNGSPIGDPTSQSGNLARQLASPLNWAACIEALAEAKVERILELGPGRALANMARSLKVFREVRALDDFRTVDGVRRWITRE
jgi:[acyl-carrier-protein] S-malonyltransferase